MTDHKLSGLQASILSKLPKTRGEIICATVNYYHPSSTYRAINTLIKRGLVTVYDSGMVRRTGK